jgi:hypothetical protein
VLPWYFLKAHAMKSIRKSYFYCSAVITYEFFSWENVPFTAYSCTMLTRDFTDAQFHRSNICMWPRSHLRLCKYGGEETRKVLHDKFKFPEVLFMLRMVNCFSFLLEAGNSSIYLTKSSCSNQYLHFNLFAIVISKRFRKFLCPILHLFVIEITLLR